MMLPIKRAIVMGASSGIGREVALLLKEQGWKVGVVPEARAVHDRAARQEPLERTVFRNYYTGSLVRLADVNRPLWERFIFVCLFTLVKAVKYRSLLPFKYFRQI